MILELDTCTVLRDRWDKSAPADGDAGVGDAVSASKVAAVTRATRGCCGRKNLGWGNTR